MIPEEISLLKFLEILSVAHNQLCELPDSIVLIKSLKELYLEGNCISRLSEELFELPNLQVII